MTVDPQRDLTVVAAELSDSVSELSGQVSVLAARSERQRRRTVVLTVSLVLDVLLTVAITILGVRVDATSECQAAQNDAFRAVSGQLRDAAAKERGALRLLLDVILDPAATPERRRQAIAEYRATLIEVDQQREDNPFPEGNCA